MDAFVVVVFATAGYPENAWQNVQVIRCRAFLNTTIWSEFRPLARKRNGFLKLYGFPIAKQVILALLFR